jgi:hypothetical protein
MPRQYAARFKSEVWVTFDPTDVEDNPTGVIHGHTVTNPLYDARQLYAHDVSVIVLDKAVKTTPVTLPSVGLLDRMKADGSIRTAVYTNVGYESLATRVQRQHDRAMEREPLIYREEVTAILGVLADLNVCPPSDS